VFFGESLSLVGFDIPGGTMRRPGEILPLSLLWRAVAPVPQDYSVGIFLMTGDGRLVAERNSYPVNYFAPTQQWRPGQLIRDNHGLQIPVGIAPGEYEVWIVVYWWQQPDERLPVRDSDGKLLGDHARLTTITVVR
jgi:hypothetical protein